MICFSNFSCLNIWKKIWVIFTNLGHFLTFEKGSPTLKKKKEKQAYMATKARKSVFGHHWMIVATFLSLPFPLFDHHQMATTFLIAIRWLMVVLITNFWTWQPSAHVIVQWWPKTIASIRWWSDCNLFPWNYMRLKKIMVSFLCYLFYTLDFVSLITHLQPLHRTSNDLRRLKSWIHEGITNHVEVKGVKSFQRWEHFMNPFLKTIEVCEWWP